MKTLVAINGLSLSPISDDLPRSVARHNGTSWTIPGIVLEGAWSFGNEILVATTEDVPFEEALHFCVLGEAGKVLDHIRLGGIYQTGAFTLIPTGSAALRFRFFGDADFELTFSDRSAWRIPFFGDPKGVYRAPGLTKRLLIRRCDA